jgi:acyl-CoA dehydrogenase family protein 9
MAAPAVDSDLELPSYAKSLFGGVIADELVFPYPADTDRAFDEWLEDLRRFLDAKVDAATFDREARIPEGVIEGLAERGVFGLYVPREYDGLGLNQLRSARAIRAVVERDASLGVLLGSHLSIGIKGIHLFGTEEQKRRWLPGCGARPWPRSPSPSPSTAPTPRTSSPAPSAARQAPGGSTATRSGSAMPIAPA